jgi:hypothetical protein
MRKLFIYVFILLLAFVFFDTKTTSAQINNQSVDLTDFTITPKYPGPNETVKIKLENYAYNLDSIEISWYLNDQLQKKGFGEKNFEFNTSSTGSVSKIKASSANFTKEVVIRPASVGLVWQTKGYTPPFYKGKALYTYQSIVDIVAIPFFTNSSGEQTDPKNLIYKWSRNDTPLENVSGYGKNIFSTSGGVLAKPLKIGVIVSSLDGSIVAKKEIVLTNNSPEIIFYENHPLYGIMYNNAISTQFNLNKKELSVSASPFFFDVTRKDDSKLSYEWSINNKNVANQDKPDSIILRRVDESNSGSALLSLSIKNPEKILQFGKISTKINFGEIEKLEQPTI